LGLLGATVSRRTPASAFIGAHRSFAKKSLRPTIEPRKQIPHTLRTSIELVKAFANAKFDETVELVVITGLDPRKPDQQLRGSCVLPHGSGQSSRIAVFAKGDKAEEALAAGADRVGAEELAAEIKEGKHNYTRILATPNMMPVVAQVAKILGPRGLMPNPKQGTLTMDISKAVTKAKQGEVQFRAEMKGQLFAPVGKVSWPTDKIEENVFVLMQAYYQQQPAGARGKYVRACSLASTKGKGVRVDISEAPFARRLTNSDYPPQFAHLAPTVDTF